MTQPSALDMRSAIPWSPPALAQLHEEHRQAGQQPSSLRAALLLAQIKAASGLFVEGDAIIRDHPAIVGGKVGAIDASILDEVLWTLFVMQRLDDLGTLLRDRESLTPRIEIAVGHGRQDFWGIEWQIKSHAHARFVFDRAMFQGGATKTLFLRFVGMFGLFAQYLRHPDVEIGTTLISLGDDDLDGGLGCCSRRPQPFLIPDYYFISSRGYDSHRRLFLEQPVDWQARRPVALWRGATTGLPDLASRNWRELPRIRLCELARSSAGSGLIDAGITTATRDAKEIANAGYMADHIAPREFQKWKYQIDIDGHTNSWPGLFMKLLTGCPVLKVASPRGYRQWYYDRLKPWINFVPVSSDLTDLAERVAWLRANDDIARDIGRQGQILAGSLDFPGELQRAAETITASVRHANAAARSSPAQAVTGAEVEMAYRMILGRAPESQEVIFRQIAAAKDLDGLRRSFLASAEFRAKLAMLLK